MIKFIITPACNSVNMICTNTQISVALSKCKKKRKIDKSKINFILGQILRNFQLQLSLKLKSIKNILCSCKHNKRTQTIISLISFLFNFSMFISFSWSYNKTTREKVAFNIAAEDEAPGVVILHIENKSAPLRGQKIINRAVNFQKFPYF